MFDKANEAHIMINHQHSLKSQTVEIDQWVDIVDTATVCIACETKRPFFLYTVLSGSIQKLKTK